MEKVNAIVLKSVEHLNRFVREISYQIINVLLAIKRGNKNDLNLEPFLFAVTKGLNDMWPQVRLAASVCARTFFTCFG